MQIAVVCSNLTLAADLKTHLYHKLTNQPTDLGDNQGWQSK